MYIYRISRRIFITRIIYVLLYCILFCSLLRWNLQSSPILHWGHCPTCSPLELRYPRHTITTTLTPIPIILRHAACRLNSRRDRPQEPLSRLWEEDMDAPAPSPLRQLPAMDHSRLFIIHRRRDSRILPTFTVSPLILNNLAGSGPTD